MLGFSELCIYLVKCVYRFLKYTGLIVPVSVAALIISVQEGYLGFSLSNSNRAIYLDFLLLYFSSIVFLYIFIKHLRKTFNELKLDVKYIKEHVNEKHVS